MKILHTSDWHLGHVLYEHERTEEQQDFLRQLQKIVSEQQPDALLVCGDVFDRVAAPISARDMYVRALLDMHDACPNMQIVVTAGNHDGKSNLDVEGLLWERLHVKVVGQPEFDNDGRLNMDRHVVEVSDAQGNLQGFIVAVPHIYEYSYPQIGDAETKEERQKQFFQALLDYTARRNPNGLPVALTAHLTMTGSNLAGHNFADSIGGIDTVDQAQLGDGYDYLAMGHIHNAKTFTGSGPMARYCGTPIAIAFDETGKHGVSLVTLEKGSEPVVEEIAINNVKPLLTIPAEPALFEDALAELSNLPNSMPAYIRLNVLLDGPMPANYVEQILQVLEPKKAQYCCVKTSLAKENKDDEAGTLLKPVDADNMPEPQELADLFFQKKYKVQMGPELMELLGQAIKAVNEQYNNL